MHKCVSFSIILVLLCCVFGLFLKNKNLKEELDSSKVDTITLKDTLIIYDTIREKLPSSKAERIIDTLLLYKTDTIVEYLTITSKMYTDGVRYKAWISGVYPRLDSIDVYSQTEYVNVTHTVYQDVLVKEWNTYFFLGCNKFDNEISPSVGMLLKSPNHWVFGIETGILNDNLWGGLKIGYKIK